MDNFEEKMNIIFNKNFETPSHYKSAVDKAINEAEYGCKKTNILHLYCFKNIAASFLIGVITLSGIRKLAAIFLKQYKCSIFVLF